MQLDADIVAGHDVCHIHGKHIGTLLLQQGGAFAFAFCFLEFLLGLFLFLDFGSDNIVPYDHLHSVNCGIGGGGKDIAGIDGAASLVGISLNHIGFRDDAVDIGGYGGFL